MGDSDLVRFRDSEYIEGMTFIQHLNQMKLSAFVTIAAVIGGSFLIPSPAEARNGWVYVESSKEESFYIKPLVKRGNIVTFATRWSDLEKQINRTVNCNTWESRTTGPWLPIVPASLGDNTAKIVCR